MRNELKQLVYGLLFVSMNISALSPYICIRSQGANAARDIVGMTNVLYQVDKDKVYGTFSSTLEYDRSFRGKGLAQCLFGSDLTSNDCTTSCEKITISGSRTADRGANDWLADYFGLPTDYKGSISFDPMIENVVFDLNFYLGLDEWLTGLYLRLDAPITHAKWHIRMCEQIESPGALPYDAGYVSPSQEFQLVRTFFDYASGASSPQLTDLVTTTTYPGGNFFPLANAKISRNPLVRVGVAELRAIVGWNWIRDDYHIGLNLHFAAPTGLRPEGSYTFEPMVGNGHHYEFGAGFSSHWNFWCNEDGSSHAGFFLDGYVTHLFKTRQHRTFDLKNKPNSRFMLAQKLGSKQQNPHLANPPQAPQFPPIEFQSQLSPVANLTTFDVDVEVAGQGEVVALFNYTSCGMSFDVGYNFYGRSCEKIIKNGCPSPLDDGITWALKGDASVIGFEDDEGINNLFRPVRLAATERPATIHSGTNFPATGTIDPTTIIAARANPNIDTPQLAVSNNSLNVTISQGPLTATNPQTRSSLNPVTINIDDVDLSGNRVVTHKLFGHFSYAWEDRLDWQPFLGAGAAVEFGRSLGKNSTCCPQPNPTSTSASACKISCNPCFDCSPSQWSVWIKGGISF